MGSGAAEIRRFHFCCNWERGGWGRRGRALRRCLIWDHCSRFWYPFSLCFPSWRFEIFSENPWLAGAHAAGPCVFRTFYDYRPPPPPPQYQSSNVCSTSGCGHVLPLDGGASDLSILASSGESGGNVSPLAWRRSCILLYHWRRIQPGIAPNNYTPPPSASLFPHLSLPQLD